MSSTNHQVRLAVRPSGLPKPSDWSFTEEPIPTPNAGEFVVAVSYLSLDPAMRGWMNAGASTSTRWKWETSCGRERWERWSSPSTLALQ